MNEITGTAAPSGATGSAAAEIAAWTRMADALRPLCADLVDSSATKDQRLSAADVNWMLLSAIGQYIVNYRDTNPDFPQFTPLLNTVFNSGAPVPDYMYYTAVIDGRGVYRLSGTRGTSRFVEFGLLNGLDGKRNIGQTVGRFSLDDITIDPDGRISAILSAQRPEGYTGDWIQIDPATSTILVRHCAVDWINDIDARLVIDRIDKPERRDRPAERDVAMELEAMVNWAGYRVGQWNRHIKRQWESGNINALKPQDFPGQVVNQLYLEGTFDIDDDHALVVDTEVPETALYWSLLVTDNSFATVDWMRHQSSLNLVQARLDSDGRFRAVIAARDPGVPNWIDTGGLHHGIIQHRWNECSSTPTPTVTKVRLDELRAALPADTPHVNAEERAAALRLRREGAQLRRRW